MSGEDGQRVRERRGRLGVDKKSLAEKAGVNRSTLAAIEAGESYNRTTLAKIQRALDTLEVRAGSGPGIAARADYSLTDRTPPGERIKQRRTALGVTVKRLAELASVDRGRLADIEHGASARDATIGAIEAALRRLENEAGLDAPDLNHSSGNGCIEFEVLGDFGARVIVRGRAAEVEMLERSVARLVRELSDKRPVSNEAGM